MRLDLIAEKLGCKLEGDSSLEILGVDKIETAGPRMLTFVANRKYLPKLKQTRAGAVIVDYNIDCNGRNVLRHANPYLAYAKALELFYEPYRPAPSISASASVAPSAKIGKDVYIGPFVFIDEDVVIGDYCYIFPNASIFRESKIGSSCVI